MLLKHLRRATVIMLAVMMLLVQTGCAVAESVINEDGDLLSAVREDLFGVKEQVCSEIRVSLPRHAGYDVLQDKTAYAALKTAEQRKAYESMERSLFLITDEWCEEKQGYVMAYAMIPELNSAEIFTVKEAVINDHPEAFWITGDYSISANMHDGSYVTLYSGCSYTDILTKMVALEQSIIAVFKEIPSNRSEYERELLIHDILVRDVSYDTDAVEIVDSYNNAATVYGTLVEKKALCSGYAVTFKLLCNRVGISCSTVNGISKDIGHMWNIVRLDGFWYHVDVTWDDPVTDGDENLIRYDYFNVTDEWISFDHDIAQGYERLEIILESPYPENEIIFFNFPLPECTATRYNFYERNAMEIEQLSYEYAAQVAELMKTTCEQGGDEIYLEFADNMEYERVVEWLNDAVGRGIASVNNAAYSEGWQQIEHCVRVVRDEDSPAHWSNLHCIKFVYEAEEEIAAS